MNISAAEAQTDLERLGDEIAVLSAHLDAATARLLVHAARIIDRGIVLESALI